jgi:hypothetical protein
VDTEERKEVMARRKTAPLKDDTDFYGRKAGPMIGVAVGMSTRGNAEEVVTAMEATARKTLRTSEYQSFPLQVNSFKVHSPHAPFKEYWMPRDGMKALQLVEHYLGFEFDRKDLTAYMISGKFPEGWHFEHWEGNWMILRDGKNRYRGRAFIRLSYDPDAFPMFEVPTFWEFA